MNSTFLKYIQNNRRRFVEREVLIDCFTVVAERPMIEISKDEVKQISTEGFINYADKKSPSLISGDIVILRHNNAETFGFVDGWPDSDHRIYGIPTEGEVPFDLYDEITIQPGDIANYNDKAMVTTVGRYLTNYVMSASIFGSTIPYVNDNWKIGSFEDQVAVGLLAKTITMEQYRTYVDQGYWLGHFAELCVPTITARSFTTDPAIKVRKAELLEEYKDQLDDPIILDKIESILLAMDKAWIEGDDSQGFIEGVNPGKSYGVHRKKMFLTVGGIESFTDGASSYNFLGNSLVEGWDKKDFAIIGNEIRKGSYARGKETAKGGGQTKFILRVFQDLAITADDCGVRKGLPVILEPKDKLSYIGRTVIGKGVITEENFASFVGAPIKLRSPLYCTTKDGLCYTCIGQQFKKLGLGALGVLAVDISSTFMLHSMKSMHGTKISTIDVQFEKYFRDPPKKAVKQIDLGNETA